MKLKRTVTVNGIDLVVGFQIHGKYIPATREQAEEYPEIEVLSIKVSDSEVDIIELLSDYQIEDIYGQLESN